MKKLEEKLIKSEKKLRKSFYLRLTLSYVFIFVPILLFTPYFFYQKAKDVLLERSFEQLITVRENSKEKLKLYLEARENHLIENEKRITENPQATSLFKDQNLLNIILMKNIKGHWQVAYQAGPISTEVKEKLISNRTLSNLFSIDGSKNINDKIPSSFFLCKKRNSLQIFCHEESFDDINSILSLRSGLGKTGEVYLVNSDHQLRSKSRFNGHWYQKKFDHEAVSKAFSGISNQEILLDYRKEKVLSAFDLFKYRNFEWAILAEIDLAEVLLPLSHFLPTTILIYIILIFAILIFIFKFSKNIFKKALTLNNQVAQLKDEQVQLTILSQEQERSTIAMNLHDSIGQNLTYLRLKLVEQNKSDLLEVCDKILIDLKDICQNIMPSVLINLGLMAAIRQVMERTNSKYPIKLELEYSQNLNDIRFKDFLEINIFRIIQELIHNSIKHSESKKLKLSMEIKAEVLVIRYHELLTKPKVFPIPLTINNRIELIEGKIECHDDKDGLTFQIHVPIKDKYYVAN